MAAAQQRIGRRREPRLHGRRLRTVTPAHHVVTIDRPGVRNALRFQSYDELEQAVRSTTARCLVITGADPAFCSGDDVRDIHVADPLHPHVCHRCLLATYCRNP